MKYDYEKGIFGNIRQLFSDLTNTDNTANAVRQRTDAITGGDSIAASEQFRAALQKYLQSLSDDDVQEFPAVLPMWEIGKVYEVDDRFTYLTNDVGDPQIYRVVQDHTSQGDWTPDITPALYVAIGITPEGYPVWSQPSGGHDAYNTGDIVSHQDKLWRSTVDGNVWEPGVYGWEEYVE